MNPSDDLRNWVRENPVMAALLAAIAGLLLVAVTLRSHKLPVAAGVPQKKTFPARHLETSTAFSIDAIIEGPERKAVAGDAHLVARVPFGEDLTIEGWAVDVVHRKAAGGVRAVIDGRQSVDADYGSERPDVASALHAEAYVDSGFGLTIPTNMLSRGRHEVKLEIADATGDGYFEARTIEATVSGPGNVPKQAEAEYFFVDTVNDQAVSAQPSGELDPVRVVRSARLKISGWAAASNLQRAHAVRLLMDGKPMALARYGLPRPDVAQAFHTDRLINSGFTFEVDANLERGVHTASFLLIDEHQRVVHIHRTLQVEVQ